MNTISFQIADWVRRTSLPGLPPSIIEATKLRAMDLTGVMLAAKDLKIVHAARDAWTATDAGGTTTPVGSKNPTSITTAAFLNGIQSSALEFDDTYLPTTMHATGLALSVCFPESQQRTVSGPKLIEAVLLACEIMIRLSIVTSRHWFDYGIHPTGSFSPFGARSGRYDDRSRARTRRFHVHRADCCVRGRHINEEPACGFRGRQRLSGDRAGRERHLRPNCCF